MSYLTETYPWITRPIVEESLVTCADEETLVQVRFEPHLEGPSWDRTWTLACERSGMLDWSCEFPEEQSFVYLSEADVGIPISGEVSAADALAALSAIVLRSAQPGGIPDPFDASDPFLDLTVDSVLEVTRDEICAGLLVPVQLDAESPTHEFCVEREACAPSGGVCPWSVRVEGATD